MRYRFLGALAVVTLTACSDTAEPALPTAVQAAVVGTPTFINAVSEAKDVQGAVVELSPVRPDWVDDPAELEKALDAVDRIGIVGFKAPGHSRMKEAVGATTMKQAVPRGIAIAGLQRLESLGVEVLNYMEGFGMATVRVPEGVAGKLMTDPLVDFVDPNMTFHSDGSVVPDVPQGQTMPWGVTNIQSQLAWAKTSGAGARVLIIDTGHNRGHPDLPSVPVVNCDEGSQDGCSDPESHGTAVAGVIMARHNGFGTVGVARFLSANDTYFWGACSGPGPACTLSDVTDGLHASDTLNLDVINMSFSQADTLAPSFAWALTVANNNGAVLVSTAGNHCHESGCSPQNGVRWPGASTIVLAVSGYNSNNTFAHPSNKSVCQDNDIYSNNGWWVDVSAPFDAYTTTGLLTYGRACGTSYAAPHVSAVAAMIRALSPNLSTVQVRTRIEATATDRGAPGWDSQFGHGALNAYRAVGPWASIPEPYEIPPWQTCEWTGSATGGYGSISYKWYKNQQLVGTNALVALSSSSNFTLELVVTDSHSFTHTKSVNIQVSSSAPDCWW